MKISLNWLREYLKTSLSPQQLATTLTDIGLEVESLERYEPIRGGLEGVVAGHVLTCGKHPDADKLSITTVDVGAGEPLQIVCGAPNVAAGQKVLVATINTTLYPKGENEGFKIKRSKIRGVESLGMICAADELGLGDDHSGIMVLSEPAVPGTPAREVLGIEDDYMIEIGLTPNRIDAASHYGVARDLAARLKTDGQEVELALPATGGFVEGDGSFTIGVEVVEPAAAPRYSGVTISGVTVAPSPEWLQNRLRTIGINPKNNVVDVTNFVLHELGQPLHGFDADKIEGGEIVVRTCNEGTPFVTLDGVERKLSAADLMICSTERPMCIAGVFGGLDSGVTESTRNVFLESACFNPVWVRKTARRHGLNTDSSFRFERGTDPDMTLTALKRAAMLIVELAGGKISSPVVDIYPDPVRPFTFEASYGRISTLIGKEIPRETIHRILDALDIKIESESGDLFTVAVPPYRVDVQREADLVEEILRIYGYNNVEIPVQVRSTLSYAPKPDKEKLTRVIGDMLAGAGFTEIMSNSLTKASYYEWEGTSYPIDRCVRIVNPLSTDLSVMRQTLLYNAMEAVELNINHRNPDLKLFEFGNTYVYDPDKANEGGLAPYSETKRLAVVMTGNFIAASWNQKSAAADFFTLKGVAEKILKRFGTDIYGLQTEAVPVAEFDGAVTVSSAGKALLTMGRVAQAVKRKFDVKPEVFFMEFDFDLLAAMAGRHKVQASVLSKFQEVKRDLALLVGKDVTFEALRREALTAERKLLKNVMLFDVYEGKNLPDGKKSYALSFIIEDTTHTLTDKEIDRVMGNLIKRFETTLGATVRS